MKTVTTSDHGLHVGDVITFGGFDRRSRWRRFIDWVLRRPAPKPVQQQFRIVQVISSSPPNYKTGERGEHRIDTFFESQS